VFSEDFAEQPVEKPCTALSEGVWGKTLDRNCQHAARPSCACRVFPLGSREDEKREQYHLEMAAIYRLHPLPYEGKLPYGMQMQNHCKYFADKAREAAKTDEELASVHEQIAQQLSQSK